MTKSRLCGRLRVVSQLISMVAIAMVATSTLVGQSVRENPSPVTNVSVKSKDESNESSVLSDRLKRLEDEIAQMQALIANQQRTIEALLAKSSVTNTAAPAAGETATTGSAVSADSAAQKDAPPLEDRVKKLESKVLSIGPFRFSGDFRLRYDGIFRGANNATPAGFAPLTHQQNSRMRYRLRFNFDTDINPKISFHGQLATGPLNNPLSQDQDFGEVTAKHMFSINEAWIDYHPNKATQLQAGRLQEIFADNSRFLFDDDIRFNGFNEKYVVSFKKNSLKVTSVDLRAGQYIFSNPNVAIVTAGSPLALAGDKVGSTGRAANLFHQGLLLNQKYNDRWSSQVGGDVQLYRNQNQIQLASTTAGVPIIVQNGLGVTLSGPLAGTGNATTTSGGAIYTAPSFQIARVTYRLNWAGWKSGNRTYPVVFNIQASRNVGISLPERDAFLGSFQVGRVVNRGDVSFLYVFSTKGANSLISQLTDDDLGTNSGVNIKTHHLRFDYGIAKKITLQSLLYIQNERHSSGDFRNFFVPLNAFTPRQYRWQEQIVFSF